MSSRFYSFLAAFLALSALVYADPGGSPTCDATLAKLQKMSAAKNDPESDEFAIDIKKKGAAYEIHLVGKNPSKSKYTGFLIYVEDEDGSRIGTWQAAPHLKNVANDECNDGMTITQVNPDEKTKGTSYTWRPPSNWSGEGAVVRAAVVVSFNDWYVIDTQI
jgi:hypothetical protein